MKFKFCASNVIAILCIALFLSFILTQTADAASATIGTIYPNRNVPAGTPISFKIESPSINLRYTISDTLSQSTISNSNISISGNFSWTPVEQDIGTHNLTITVIDQNNVQTVLTETLIVTQASSVSIINTSKTSGFPGETLSFGVAAPGYVSPAYYISDTFTGSIGSGIMSTSYSTISNSNIDSYGNFSWKPTNRDVGVHALHVTVNGQSGRRDTVYQTLTIAGITLEQIPPTVPVDSTVRIPVKMHALSSPSFSFKDSLRNNTIDTAKIEDNYVTDYFVWTPDVRDVGRHTITITVGDGTNISETTFDLEVIGKTVAAPVVVLSPSVAAPVVTSSKPATNVTAKYKFTSDLKVGSKGSDVSELQKRLKVEGVYSNVINGVFGPATKAGVIAYQQKMKISKTGTVGPLTRAALNK